MVHLRTLGECALETDVGRIGPDSRYVFALGLYLVLERGKRIPRQALVDLLWPDVDDDSQARHRFRQTLLRLKQLGVPVSTDQGHLRLERDIASTDFDALLLHVNGEAEDVVRSRESFEFLHGYQPRISEQFGTWLDLHRARVELAIQRVFVHALKSARDRGDWPAVEQLALGCLRIDSLNEEATMARAEATAMRGSKAQALRILDGYMDALGERSLSIGLPAKMLRSRIAERMTQPQYLTLSEAHFVGREEEVALLTGMLDEAKHGRGGAVLLRGAAGIGKTRLVTEITRIAALRPTTVVRVNCQPTSVDRPIGLLADLVTALRSSPGSLGAAVESLALLQRLTEYTEPAPVTHDFAETGVAGSAIRRAVFDLFEAVADENTLLVTIEDTHWADAFSWKIVKTLAESAPRRRVLIVATARDVRPDDAADSSGEPFRVRDLPPLNTAASQSLVTKLLADYGSDIPQEMLSWCVSVADGNPYYLRELLTRWLETREPFGVPQSLSELVDRKLGRLSPEALRVFQACVAFGSSCTVARLERIEATEPTQLIRALEELSLGGLIISDGTEIQPKHDLLAQAARQRMPPALKTLVHRRIATVLEAESTAFPEPTTLWDCAHHWELAGDQTRAVAFLASCGRHLIAVGLPEEAAALYKRALQLDVGDSDQYIELHSGLAAALRKSGLLEQVIAQVSALRRAAELRNHKLELHSDIELLEIEAHWRSQEAREIITDRLRRCVAATDASATHRLHAAYWLLAIASSIGDELLTRSTWTRVEPLVLSPSGDAVARYQVAMVYHADYGDLDKGVEYARLLAQAARERGDAVTLHRALKNASMSFRRAGHPEEAKSVLYEALELAKQHRATLSAVECAHLLASLALEEGDLSSADAWIIQARDWSARCESELQKVDIALVGARIAIAQRDILRSHDIAIALREWKDEPSSRLRQAIVSIRMALALENNDANAIRELLSVAAQEYARFAELGGQDFNVEMLAKGYAATGDTKKAAEVLSSYLTTKRRDRGAVPATLADLGQSLGARLPPPRPKR